MFISFFSVVYQHSLTFIVQPTLKVPKPMLRTAYTETPRAVTSGCKLKDQSFLLGCLHLGIKKMTSSRHWRVIADDFNLLQMDIC